MCGKGVSKLSESDPCAFVESVNMDPSSAVSVHDAEAGLLKGAMDSECGNVCVPLEWVPLTKTVLDVCG